MNKNPGVTKLIDDLQLILRDEVEYLREIILCANDGLTENIKWNGPNYSFDGNDRITMKVQPPKQVQLIFHVGAKVKAQPKDRLINDPSGMLQWKENDRAVAGFTRMAEIKAKETELRETVRAWIAAAI